MKLMCSLAAAAQWLHLSVRQQRTRRCTGRALAAAPTSGKLLRQKTSTVALALVLALPTLASQQARDSVAFSHSSTSGAPSGALAALQSGGGGRRSNSVRAGLVLRTALQ